MPDSRPRNEFGRNVATLMTGTMLAQVLPIALSPVLSRLYGPTDFGVVALFAAITAVLSVMATGRYELAIVQPRSDAEAANVAALGTAVLSGVGVLLATLVLVFHDTIATAMGGGELAGWIFLLPVSIVLASLYQVLNYWNNRHKRFKQLAVSRAVQSAGMVGTQCGLGYPQGAAGGLIVGVVVGQLCAVLALATANRNAAASWFRAVSWQGMKQAALRYRSYPMYSSWGALLDTAALQMPLFAISHLFGNTATGLFSLALRVMTVPLNLIASSVAQVLLQRVAEMQNDNPGALRSYVLKIVLFLSCLGLPVVALLSLFGEDIFSFVFGREWQEAGRFAGLLVLAAVARFVVYPCSVVLSLDRHVKKGVAWQTLYFCTLTTVLLLFAHQPIEQFLLAFVVHEVVLYGIYLAVILLAAGSSAPAASGVANRCDAVQASPHKL